MRGLEAAKSRLEGELVESARLFQGLNQKLQGLKDQAEAAEDRAREAEERAAQARQSLGP